MSAPGGAGGARIVHHHQRLRGGADPLGLSSAFRPVTRAAQQKQRIPSDCEGDVLLKVVTQSCNSSHNS
eukprot:scaffold12183_cov68-Phaeocystis_antarctica.AAC.16